jgi:hypothetical protein
LLGTHRRSGSSGELMGMDEDTIALPVDRDESPRLSKSQSVRNYGGSSDMYSIGNRRGGTKSSAAAWSTASNSTSMHGTASSSKAHITHREKDDRNGGLEAMGESGTNIMGNGSSR